MPDVSRRSLASLLGLAATANASPGKAQEVLSHEDDSNSLHVLDFIPSKYHDEIVSGESAGNEFSGYINEAIRKAASGAGGRGCRVRLPSGVLKTGYAIMGADNVVLAGAGTGLSDKKNAGLNSTSIQPLDDGKQKWMVDYGGAGGFFVEDLSLFSPITVNLQLGGIRAGGIISGGRRVHISNFQQHAILEDARISPQNTRWEHCRAYNCLRGLRNLSDLDTPVGSIEIVGVDAFLLGCHAYGGQHKLISKDGRLNHVGIYIKSGFAQCIAPWAEQCDVGIRVDGYQTTLSMPNTERNFGPGYLINAGMILGGRSSGDCMGGNGQLDAFQFGLSSKPIQLVGCTAGPTESPIDKASFHRFGFGVGNKHDTITRVWAESPRLAACRSMGHLRGEFDRYMTVLDGGYGYRTDRPLKAPIGTSFFDQDLGLSICAAAVDQDGWTTRWVNGAGTPV